MNDSGGKQTVEGIPDAWVPGLTKLCRPKEDGHQHRGEPCGKQAGKRPLHKGFNADAVRRYREATRASVDEHRRTAQEWLDEGYNLGIVPPPGVVVLDCDSEAAVEWVSGHLADAWQCGETIPCQTRGPEKAHFWLRYDESELPLKATQLRFTAVEGGPTLAIDLRVGGRSQAVVAPSHHVSGLHYEWLEPLPPEIVDVAVIPGPLRAALEKLLGLDQRPAGGGLGILAREEGGEAIFLPGRGGLPTAAESFAGHDRLRSYINRLCRYTPAGDPARALAEIRTRAERFARDLYAGPDRVRRLEMVLSEGGELERLLVSGWERFGGRAPLLEDRTDQGYIDTLIATHGEKWRWLVERAQWREWDPAEGLWVETHEELVGRAIGLLHHELFEDSLREPDMDRKERLWAMSKQLRNSSKVRSILARMKQAYGVSEALFDADPWLLCFPAGVAHGVRHEAVVLDLAADDVTGSARAPRMEDYLTRAMGAPWIPVEELGASPRARRDWEAFLASSIPDPELRAYAQRAAGLSACGVTLAHVFFFLFGPGGTGKSTLLNAMAAAFGGYAVRCDFRTFAEDHRRSSSGASPDVARLRGARLAVCSEIPDKTYLGARMKDLTGGDRIVGRHLFGREVEFAPSHTVWLAGNCEPAAEYLDTGVWRRLQQLPFDTVHARVDATLPLRLGSPEALSELGRWVVAGWVEYRSAGGLGECPAVRQATEAFRSRVDPLAEWWDECCEIEAGSRVPSADALVHFRAHADARGAGFAGRINPTRFAAMLKARGVETAKGPKGIRLFLGLKIRNLAPSMGVRGRVGVAGVAG